jgi:hypothetical protein
MNEPSPLGDYLDRLEWSAERLVREINRISGPGTTTAKAPYGWIKGSCPRGRLPETVASILSGQLGEHITAQMLWPKRARETLVHLPHLDLDLPWTPRGAWQAAGLLSGHLTGPSPVRPPVLPGPSLVGPALDWLTADDEEPSSQQVGRQIVGPEAVQVLRDRIGQLRRLDDAQGGPLVLEWVTQDLRWAASLVHNGSYDPATGIELHGVVAELAQLAGWLACDQGRAGIGQRYLLAGLHFAHTAHDAILGANIVSCLSYQAMWSGEYQDALRLIRAARKGAGGPRTGRVHALLATRQARAHAQLRDDAACAKALDEASSAYAEGGETPDPSWAYWVSDAVLAADAGRAWLELERPERAEPNLVRGLQLFGDAQPRNRMLHHASLAEARLALGDVDGAADAAHGALNLGEQLVSGRAHVRLRTLASGFARVDSPLARGVVDRAKDALAS